MFDLFTQHDANTLARMARKNGSRIVKPLADDEEEEKKTGLSALELELTDKAVNKAVYESIRAGKRRKREVQRSVRRELIFQCVQCESRGKPMTPSMVVYRGLTIGNVVTVSAHLTALFQLGRLSRMKVKGKNGKPVYAYWVQK